MIVRVGNNYCHSKKRPMQMAIIIAIPIITEKSEKIKTGSKRRTP
ncbi:hypothetical protein HMPREF9554_00496 [Treponema phagedenis F0421]|nr:hypothetical protein HMPREF9554_00496 [Treponema phagedenis F0421]